MSGWAGEERGCARADYSQGASQMGSTHVGGGACSGSARQPLLEHRVFFPASADHPNDMFAACRYVAQHAFLITSYRLRRRCSPAHMNLINRERRSSVENPSKVKFLVLYW